MLTLLSNCLTNINLSDMETCYKVFRREVIQAIPLEEDRFGFEPEITVKVARRKLRIYEVGISYSGRTYEEGKKIGWKDGVRALYCLVKYSLKEPRAEAAPVQAASAPLRSWSGPPALMLVPIRISSVFPSSRASDYDARALPTLAWELPYVNPDLGKLLAATHRRLAECPASRLGLGDLDPIYPTF